MHQLCKKCGKTSDQQFKPFCECGGMTDVEYDLRKVSFSDSPNPYIRFADLLPISPGNDRLPADARFTPTVHATRLGAALGMPSLYLKDETALPTSTTKDRMAVVSLAYLWECGVRGFCTSSTGNSSTAYAHAIRNHPDMRLCIFTAEDFVQRVQLAIHPQIEHFVMRDATFVDAFQYSRTYAEQNGLTAERGFFNPGRREGLKLAFLEAAEQVETPIDWYVQAVSSAMGVYGTYNAAKQLQGLGRIDRLPRLLCVQQESCAPMARAFSEGSATIQPQHIVARPAGIAESILRGDPTQTYPLIRSMVLESKGDFAMVSNAEIREARQMVEDLEGISPCFSASTALAGLIRLVRQQNFPKGDTVLINLTGADRPRTFETDHIRWVQRDSSGWAVEAPSRKPAGAPENFAC